VTINPFSGNKEIHAVNLIRIGVAKALAPTVLRVAKYRINWEMKSLAELRPLYDRVIGFLTGNDHGEYLAMKEIFGEEVAIRTAVRGEMKLPAFISNEQRRAIQE
jgi:hypothetical protein